MNLHSHSSLNTFLQCPAQYKLHYLDRVDPAPVEGFREGSLLHEAVEEYGRWCRSQDVASDLDRMRAIAGRFDEEDLADALNGFAEGHQYDWSLTVSDSEAVEKWFDVPLPGDYGRMRGRIDLLQYNEAENALWVTDWKSWAPSTQPETCPKQLRLYAWAMLQEYPSVSRVICRLEYLRRGDPHEWELYAPVSIEWATAIIDRIRAEREWEATPGNACAFCGYREQCPVREVIPEYPFERAAEMLRLDAWVKEEKTWLRKHADQHGPIPVGNGRLDIRPSDGARRMKPRRNAKLDLLKAIAKTRLPNDLPGEQVDLLLDSLAAVSEVVKFDTAALAQYAPVPGNVFAAQDASGETVDLSHLLDQQAPSNVFGFCPDEPDEEGGDD